MQRDGDRVGRLAHRDRPAGVYLFATVAGLGVPGTLLHGVSPGQQFGARLANLERQVLHPDAQRDPVVVGNLLPGLDDPGGNVVGDEGHLFVGLSARGPGSEVDVVDVAAGAVGHDADERRMLPVGFQKLLNPVGEDAEVVGRHVAVLHAADVVQRVVRKQRDLSATGRLDRDEGDFRVGRPGRLDQVLVASRGVHAGLVHTAKGVGQFRPGLHEPAAVVDVLGRAGRAPADPCRLQIVYRPADTVGDAPGEEPLVLEQRLAPQGRGASGGGGRVRVRRAHQHVARREVGLLADPPPRLVEDLAIDAEIVAHHQGQARLAVVEHQASRVKLIVDVGGLNGAPPADDPLPQRWCDVGRRRAGAEQPGGLPGLRLPLRGFRQTHAKCQNRHGQDHGSGTVGTVSHATLLGKARRDHWRGLSLFEQPGWCTPTFQNSPVSGQDTLPYPQCSVKGHGYPGRLPRGAA